MDIKKVIKIATFGFLFIILIGVILFVFNYGNYKPYKLSAYTDEGVKCTLQENIFDSVKCSKVCENYYQDCICFGSVSEYLTYPSSYRCTGIHFCSKIEEFDNCRPPADCGRLQILEIGGSPKICYSKLNDSTQISLIIENSGSSNILGIIINTTMKDDTSQILELKQDISNKDAIKVLLNYSSDINKINKITLTPINKVWATNMPMVCTKGILVLNETIINDATIC